MTTISLIVAMDRNRVIGNHNQLPWHLPADLKHFKDLTMGKPIVMGRHTYESIGKPLPGRRNVVITSRHITIAGCEVFQSLESAIAALKKNHEEIMVIGGAHVFAQIMPQVSKMYITLIDHEFSGDTYFPAWNEKEWREVTRESFKPDEKNPYRFSFIELKRL